MEKIMDSITYSASPTAEIFYYGVSGTLDPVYFLVDSKDKIPTPKKQVFFEKRYDVAVQKIQRLSSAEDKILNSQNSFHFYGGYSLIEDDPYFFAVENWEEIPSDYKYLLFADSKEKAFEKAGRAHVNYLNSIKWNDNKKYFYGYSLTKGKKKRSFFCVENISSLKDKEIVFIEVGFVSRNEALVLADRILQEKYNSVWNKIEVDSLDKKEPTVEPAKAIEFVEEIKEPSLQPGAVAIHFDRERSHHSIILDVGENKSKALFFTSSTKWGQNKTTRRATTDELALAGFPVRKVSYLSLVERDNADFQIRDWTFPEWRVEALKKEFIK